MKTVWKVKIQCFREQENSCNLKVGITAVLRGERILWKTMSDLSDTFFDTVLETMLRLLMQRTILQIEMCKVLFVKASIKVIQTINAGIAW